MQKKVVTSVDAKVVPCCLAFREIRSWCAQLGAKKVDQLATAKVEKLESFVVAKQSRVNAFEPLTSESFGAGEVASESRVDAPSVAALEDRVAVPS